MLIVPAIDLKDGCVVRLFQGRKDKKVYSTDPVAVAGFWARQGARMLHVVDLDGAFTGVPQNLGIVKKIVRSIDIPVEFGGGVRSLETVQALVKSGVQRVVLGTRAVEDRDFLEAAFKKFKQKIVVGIDAKKGRIMTEGWKKTARSSGLSGFVSYLKKLGLKNIIYTDILKDGTLQGPNVQAVKGLLRIADLRVIASGGISSLADISRLLPLEKKGLYGIIVGKALYEHKFTLQEALQVVDEYKCLSA
ncbi:MAG: 1-(5-phosphoribosyl)-5-[(5-phosphoribosylamino)methylideneamino]imidazole-4-carboxamide isomerase [Candidatus Omnitrophota bacterium]|jgi:phosphoribosylformimino-5-aminoimidazole carboxamide ribotide isomerase